MDKDTLGSRKRDLKHEKHLMRHSSWATSFPSTVHGNYCSDFLEREMVSLLCQSPPKPTVRGGKAGVPVICIFPLLMLHKEEKFG